MPAEAVRRLYYVDANVLLAYVGNETGGADIVEALLDEARRGEIEIITSVLSIAEVAFGAQERDAGLTPEGEAHIDTLWQPASPITLVDVSETTAREARRLSAVRSRGRHRPTSLRSPHQSRR
jgi:predicted nucleic acid-binding protein